MKPFYTNVVQTGSRIGYRGVDHNGIRVRVEAPFNPEFFTPASAGGEGVFKNLYGQPLERVLFADDVNTSGVRKAQDYIKQYSDLPEYKIYGQTNLPNQFIRLHNPSDVEFDISKVCIAAIDIETECENGFPDVNVAAEEIICLTLYESLTKTYWVFSNTERGRLRTEKFYDYQKHGEKVVAIECENEIAMLSAFMRKWQKDLDYPDILTGWNSVKFDVPYLINRLYRLFPNNHALVDDRLSPWGYIKSREFVDAYNNTNTTFTISGVQILDYMELYQKFNMDKQESYALAHIAHVELGEAKLSYEEYDSMHMFYLKDYPKFVEYNLKDVWLINRLEDKIKLMEFAVTLAYMAKVNYGDVFYPTRTIESLCYDYLLSSNIIMEAKRHGDTAAKTAYVGAFVKDPHLGLHDWVVSFDLNSLYPSIIRQLNLSPETLRPEFENPSVDIDSLLEKRADLSYLKSDDLAVAANGHHFSRSQLGFLPQVVEHLVTERKRVKKEMLAAEQNLQTAFGKEAKAALEYEIAFKHLKQLALKILANSIYGAMGNQYFVFYDTRLASAITKHGQYVIRLIEGEINRFMNHLLGTAGEDYVLYMDTDSIYVAFDKIVENYKKKTGETDTRKIVDYVDIVCKERVEPWIAKVYERMAVETNAYEPHMVMKREVIASRGVWKAKKMYALYVYDSEGVRFAEPKMKIMGIETQRSSTPEWCRVHLKTAIKKILTSTEKDVRDYVASIKAEYYALSPSDIAFPRGLNDMNKWIVDDKVLVFEDDEYNNLTTAKGTPINVRAAHVHNTMIRELGIAAQYREIRPGNKIKFLYLREPNPCKSNVVGFVNSLPKEFGATDYIDYDQMFQKSFLKPLQNLLDVIGWTAEKTHNTLDEIFGWE